MTPIKRKVQSFLNSLVNKIDIGNEFTIEYYPIKNRYYPKVGNYYMIENTYNKCIDSIDYNYFEYSIWCETKEKALEVINKYKEDKKKKEVVVITVE